MDNKFFSSVLSLRSLNPVIASFAILPFEKVPFVCVGLAFSFALICLFVRSEVTRASREYLGRRPLRGFNHNRRIFYQAQFVHDGV